MEKIKQLTLPENCRLVVISDIHGNLVLLQQLLAKVHLKTEDFLIFNGDLIEKGKNSSEVLSTILNMQKQNPRVLVTEGNCEVFAVALLEKPDWLIPYLNKQNHSLFHEWLHSLNKDIDSFDDVQDLIDFLLDHFSEEIHWLHSLPSAIECEDFIFVHAGLSDVPDWKTTSQKEALSMPGFLAHSHQADKYVIVGHYPVSNYACPTDHPDHSIIVDQERKIIAIDGGNQVKTDGQLNALIISKKNSAVAFEKSSIDAFPIKKIKKDYVPPADPYFGNIHYPDLEVRLLKKGKHFSLCKNTRTRQTLWIKNEYLSSFNRNTTLKNDATSCQFSVKQGEKVSVIDAAADGYALIKKNGKTGWIPKDILLG